MTTEVLGSLSFLNLPTVGGFNVMLDLGGVPTFNAGALASRPAAGNTGRMYIDTTNNILYRDNGASWDAVGSSTAYTGTTNQITVAGTVISLSSDPIIPGNGGMTIPTGTTAQRGSSTAGNIRQNSTLGYAEIYDGAAWRPLGKLLQRVTVNVPATTGTNTFTLGTTVPTTTTMPISVVTQSFTPLSPSSTVLARFVGTIGSGTNNRGVLLSIFSDTTHQVSTGTQCATGNLPYPTAAQATWQPGSTAAISVTLRAAMFGGNGTWSVSAAGTVTLGGGFASDLVIEEYI